MAHRNFVDRGGIVWSAWDVHPAWMERRTATNGAGPQPAAERRVQEDGEQRVRGDPTLASGWLAFESARGRRRLAPFPSDWAQLTDAGLSDLLLHAREVPPVDRSRIDTGDLRRP